VHKWGQHDIITWKLISRVVEENEMTYRGHVENGIVVLDDRVALPEGAPVQVDVLDEEEGATLYEWLKSVFGKAKGLPPDAAQRTGHCLYD
jgi:hypothetical protein